MLYRLRILLILLALSPLQTTLYAKFPYPNKMVINVPIVDLRSAPEAALAHVNLPTSDLTNPLQETQLLFGEHVLATEQFIDSFGKKWLYIQALQQDHYSFMLEWHKYRGWIQADQVTIVNNYPSCNLVIKNLQAPIYDEYEKNICTVSIGTRFMGTSNKNNDAWQITLPSGNIAWINDKDVYQIQTTIQESEDDLRANIVATAMKFLESFYCWGGRSAQCDDYKISGVDCSGLINLAFLAHGLQIPRMSNDQYLTAHKIKFGADLKPGDLILFDPVHKYRNPLHMTHVMMYVAKDLLLEATFAGKSKIRTISFQDRIGKSSQDTISGDITQTTLVDDNADDTKYFVYFCSYLSSPNTLQRLRDNALGQTWTPLQLIQEFS